MYVCFYLCVCGFFELMRKLNMEIIDKRKRGGVYALNRKRKKERKKGRLILRRGRNKFSQKCCKFWQVRRYCKGKSVEFISAINFHSRKNYISQKMLYILINYIRKLNREIFERERKSVY